jgi:hypothetical protein
MSIGSTNRPEPEPRKYPWWHYAACRDRLDLDWIEPTKREKARCCAICATCPVQANCREAALVAGEAWGIWGGLDPDERAIIAAACGYPVPTSLPVHGTNSRYAKHGCRCMSCRQAHTNHERDRLGRRPQRCAESSGGPQAEPA